MRHTLGVIVVLVAAAVWVRPARAEDKRVRVEVVEVAGGRAFIAPCEDQGLAVGTKVAFGKRTLVVDIATAKHCGLDLAGTTLSRGAKGTARVSAASASEATVLAKPEPLTAYGDAWAEPRLPASLQTVKVVPLGMSVGAPGRLQGALIAGAAGWAPISDGDAVARMSIGARLHAEPWSEVPFGVDADVLASQWLGRGLDQDNGRDSRPALAVNELRLRYGRAANPLVGLGRLRWAAATVGLLDGVRVRTPNYSGFTVAGYGGFVPNALDGRPDFDTSRFGVEAVYSAPTHKLRPYLDLNVAGSYFDGAIDEKRLSVGGMVMPGPLLLSGRADVALFEDDNPWGLDTVELTSASVDIRFRQGGYHAGVTGNLRQPERSNWLATLLPPSWLCVRTPQAPAVPPAMEPCRGNRLQRLFVGADGGIDLGRFGAAGGATSVLTVGSDEDPEIGGFLDLRLSNLPVGIRLGLGGMLTSGEFLDSAAVRLTVGAPIGELVDVGAYYRPAVLSYIAAEDFFVEHRAGADLNFFILPTLDLDVTLEIATGDDVDAVGAFATAIWHFSRE